MALMGQGNTPPQLPPGASLAPGASLPTTAGLPARALSPPPQQQGGFGQVGFGTGGGPLNSLAGMDPNLLRALLQRIGIGAAPGTTPANSPPQANGG